MKIVLWLVALVFVIPLIAVVIYAMVFTARVEAKFPATGILVGEAGRKVHVIEQGAAGPTVLMIHGASANAREFTQTLAPRLTDTHRVLMADRPGHGYSERPAASRTLGVQAEQMAAVLDALAPGEKITIVGHSFGGAVALRLALDFPDKVNALVLLAPVSHDWGADSSAWYSKAAAHPVLGPVFTQLIPLVGRGQLEAGVASTFHPDPAPQSYIENSGALLLFRPSEFRANARDVAILRTELAAQQGRYGELEMPITLFSGLRDTVLNPKLHAGKLIKQVPQLRIVSLDASGHMPHHGHGADIAETIRSLSLAAISQ